MQKTVERAYRVLVFHAVNDMLKKSLQVSGTVEDQNTETSRRLSALTLRQHEINIHPSNNRGLQTHRHSSNNKRTPENIDV
jgi:hypothetical protein